MMKKRTKKRAGGRSVARGDRVERQPILNLRGSPEYARWLDEVSAKTHINKATIFRLALAEWAKRNRHPQPPEI